VTTFGDLRTRAHEILGRTIGPDEWPFVVLATDVTCGRLVRLPEHYIRYGLDPAKQRIADAVRASLSIPIFYRPAAVDEAVLVDGGVLSNYAIGIFDAATPAQARWPTFGMTLLGTSKSPALGREFARSVWPLLRVIPRRVPIIEFGEALIGAAIVGQDENELARRGVAQRTIRIDTDGFGIVAFNIDRDGKRELINRGRKAAEIFMAAWARNPDDGRSGVGLFPLPPIEAVA
jgi:NTE family protein